MRSVICLHTIPLRMGVSPQALKGPVEVCLGVPTRPAFQQRAVQAVTEQEGGTRKL